MENSPIDLNAYALGEATPAERDAAAVLLSQSFEAREDFERLQLTLAALSGIREEEMPRRIAFVSDPVFEPSWWQRFFSSAPKLGFAGASLLAAAITAHGFLLRPVPQQAALPIAAIRQADVDAAVGAAVGAAVAKAVSAAVQTVDARADARVHQQVQVALSDAEKRFSTERQMMAVSFEENLSILRKQMNRMYVTNAGLTVGGPKE